MTVMSTAWIIVVNCPLEASTSPAVRQNIAPAHINRSSIIGQFIMPSSNNRFWFYMDNIEKQLESVLTQKNLTHDDQEKLKQLIEEAQWIKKSRVTYKEVRDYIENNHKYLSDFGVVDPHKNGFSD
ncbi:MAG: hypothetical protein ACTHJ4_02520 [Candidatus Nucleicultricaceae bacterium]